MSNAMRNGSANVETSYYLWRLRSRVLHTDFLDRRTYLIFTQNSFFRHKNIRAYFYFHAKAQRARNVMFLCSFVKRTVVNQKEPRHAEALLISVMSFKTSPSYRLRYTLPWWLSLRACQRGRRWFGVCRWWGLWIRQWFRHPCRLR